MTAGVRSCPDDRIVLARRGGIDPTEWDAIMAHVHGCDDCAAAWTAARSFERVGGAQPADELLVGRAVQAALDRHSPRGRFTRRPMLAVAASLLLAGAAASAGMIAYRELRHPRVAPPSATPAAGKPGAHRARRPHHGVGAASEQPAEAAIDDAPLEQPTIEDVPPPAPAPAPAVAPPAGPAGPDVIRPTHSGDRSASAIAPVSTEARRAALFARATAARGAGRSAEAAALFLRLQREFPNTPEATVSLVSLGELQIASSPRAALASFDRYLRQAPSGPLAPEALAAKARALDELGRPSDAEAARRELRRRIPEWPYVAAPRAGGDRGEAEPPP